MKQMLIAMAALATAMLSNLNFAQAEAIQTQMCVAGDCEADIIKAKVDGKVLTIVMSFRNTGDVKTNTYFTWRDVFFINKDQNKKYGVLKDSNNKFIASTQHSVHLKIAPTKKQLVWFKFPAPPEGDETINLTLPATMPFDSLRISR